MTRKQENPPSALRVQDGIAQPAPVNQGAVQRLKKVRKQLFTAEEYYNGIIRGDRTLLSQAITLVESALPAHREIAANIIALCLPHCGKSFRIGITGVPGVGKSTFIEAFGTYLTALEHRVAVLAVDPSSRRSGGSILGDKTRMETLANDPNAFIRPSPAAGSLGGVARKTGETAILCEAAGFDVILVETVGVGQSETTVHGMTDFSLLLMLPGAGDELQGIKRGIMEMADLILINKSDGDQERLARQANIQYTNAIHLFQPSESGWVPRVENCSSVTGLGIDTAWRLISDYRRHCSLSGYLEKKRQAQSRQIMLDTIEERLKQDFFQHPAVVKEMARMDEKLLNNQISSYEAAGRLIKVFENCRNTKKGE
ncbi:MAG TPA: methylmalonyl Co-A mutase-associated GTPase MeaB [Bacteroidales bacterium]|nr:methylmalonyl Co-A mutase-associated GTPase MeaB [Bacteroidales bacterium]HSA43015.1 methylmalonyl Co-A mutase-associated GTPase MeaB [Bacteroidales bacterium]